MVHVIGLDGCHRTGEVVLLCPTVTDNDNVVEHLGVFLQCHYNVRRSGNDLRGVANVAHLQFVTMITAKRKVTVDVRSSAVARSLNQNGGTDNRFAGSILNMPIDSDLLCNGRSRKKKEA